MAALFTWLGTQDVEAFRNQDIMGGPIPSMLETGNFSHAIILSNWRDNLRPKNNNTSGRQNPTEKECLETLDWLQAKSDIIIKYHTVDLENPTDTGNVYLHSLAAIEDFQSEEDEHDFSFNLSSGTWAMAIAWAIISKTQYKARCLASSKKGPAETDIPFDIKADLIPEIVKTEISKYRDPGLQSIMVESNEFYQKATFRGEAMLRTYEDAILAADHAFPVFIMGNLGTEKSVIAKLIHKNDYIRSGGPFVRVFCGSDHSREIDQKLFGARRPITRKKIIDETFDKSFYEEAEGGTLYLEDVDKLSSLAQSFLLEKIEAAEKAYSKKLGKADTLPRILVSSKVELLDAVRDNQFSEQLFFKLSAITIKVPDLSERGEDVLTVANSILETINLMRTGDTSYSAKRFAPSAENFIQNHKWIGNLLELEATVKRAAFKTRRDSITEEDMYRSTIALPQKGQNLDEILNQPLDENLKLKEIVNKVAKHYLIRADEQSDGNTSLAYKLVGLQNYQTFRNWYIKHVEKDGK